MYRLMNASKVIGCFDPVEAAKSSQTHLLSLSYCIVM